MLTRVSAALRDDTDSSEKEELVRAVEAREPGADERLYEFVRYCVKGRLTRKMCIEDARDELHNVYMNVLVTIREGKIRSASAIAGFVKTLGIRAVSAYIDRAVVDRNTVVIEPRSMPSRELSPETQVFILQRRERAAKALKALSAKDREILTRFYLHEQTKDEICRAMELNETQFRLLKSRAKARFSAVLEKKMALTNAKLGGLSTPIAAASPATQTFHPDKFETGLVTAR
jgi:RNA polymerase sigma factor (sigma-70 family)